MPPLAQHPSATTDFPSFEPLLFLVMFALLLSSSLFVSSADLVLRYFIKIYWRVRCTALCFVFERSGVRRGTLLMRRFA